MSGVQISSGWSAGDHTYLMRRAGDSRKAAIVPARFDFFLENPPARLLSRLRSDPRAAVLDGEEFVRVRARRTPGPGSPSLAATRAALVREMVAEIGPERVREADVMPLERILADEDVTISPDIRVAFLDLEAQSPGMGIDDARAGRARVLSFAALGYDGRACADILFRGDPRHGADMTPSELDAEETRLLGRLLRFLRGYDAVVAWYGGSEREGDGRNGRGFDFDCLRNRAAALGITPADVFGKPWASWRVWVWLDQLDVYKKFSQADGAGKSSTALDHVARSLALGEGKLDLDAGRVWEFWADPATREDVLAYNVQDTALLPRIEEKTGYLALHFGICRICNIVPHTTSTNATAHADGYLLRYAGARGYRWPSVWRGDGEPPVPGAFVFPTKRTGVVENVCIADFSRLYPSIMQTLNIGPDTVFTQKDQVPAGIPVAKAPEHDAWFRLDRPSFFTAALGETIANRARYQDEMAAATPGSAEHTIAKNLDAAAKILCNSFYGVLLCNWRYYSRAAGTAVTTTGVWLIKMVAEAAEAAGFEVIAGDTDSVFVWVKDDPLAPPDSGAELSETGERFRAFVRQMNASWPERFAPFGGIPGFIDLDWEKVIARMVFPVGKDGRAAKKMYAGAMSWFKGRRPKTPFMRLVRGLAVRRGDTIGFARDMLGETLDMILGRDEDTALPEIPAVDVVRAWLSDWRARIVHGDLTVGDVVVRKALSKPLDSYFHTPFTTSYCAKCRADFKTATDPKGIDKDGPATCACGVERKRRPAPPHARVARGMRDAGNSPLVGDRIPFVTVLDGKTSVPVHADSADLDRLDRGYYFGAAWAPSWRIWQAVHPDGEWEKPDRARSRIQRSERARLRDAASGQLGLFARPERVVTAVTVVVRDQTVIADLRAACAAAPGDAPLRIRALTRGAETTIATAVTVNELTLSADERFTYLGDATYEYE